MFCDQLTIILIFLSRFQLLKDFYLELENYFIVFPLFDEKSLIRLINALKRVFIIEGFIVNDFITGLKHIF